MTKQAKSFNLHSMLRNLIKTPFIIAALLIVTGGTTFYFYSQYQKSQEKIRLLENPQEAARIEAVKLTEAVSELMTLPSDETPTVATVTDKDKLSEQPFFQNAENGDKVLIYTQTKRAILYRPGTNKIIDVAPINIGTSSGTVAGADTTIRVAVYNGTTTAGLANTIEKDLETQAKNVDVVAKANAKKNDYTETLVIDLTGKLKTAAEEIAKLLGGEVGTIPDGETKPANTDILIIIGK